MTEGSPAVMTAIIPVVRRLPCPHETDTAPHMRVGGVAGIAIVEQEAATGQSRLPVQVRPGWE